MCPAFLRQWRCAGLAFLVCVSFPLSAMEVSYNRPASDGLSYMQDLLRLALSYSETEYTFATTDETFSRARWLESVRNGTLSLIWGGTSEQMEEEFIPVRIDAYRGLMGHRILIIREGDQARFEGIRTLDDLRRVTMGQGRTWQDGRILEQSGFTVVRSNKRDGLFYMLDGGRFDAFPRGAHEAYNEVTQFPQLPLTVEESLVVVYPLPTYFFVHKGYPELARDIENGLEAAIADGRFDQLFYSSPQVVGVLRQARLHQRRAINIPNPFLPAATPLDRPELWLTIEDFRRAAQMLENE